MLFYLIYNKIVEFGFMMFGVNKTYPQKVIKAKSANPNHKPPGFFRIIQHYNKFVMMHTYTKADLS